MTQFMATSLLLAMFGLLLVLGAVLSRVADRLGLPVTLLFIGLGMLAGSEGIGGIAFDDYEFAFEVGTMALVLILFDGGLNTSYSSMRRALWPASVLATVGVVATAGLMGVAARMLGLPWVTALLLGAVVSSTDAATVFAMLRGGSLRLRGRLGRVLELESGLNDPAAVILTVTLTQVAMGQANLSWTLALLIPFQLGVGVAVGVAMGLFSRELLRRVTLSAGGLFPVITVGLSLLTFGAATGLQGSGFLAVFTMGVVLGNGPIPYKAGLRRIHDALGWVCQVSVFLMFGLLVFPSRLPDMLGVGLVLALLLALVARPLAVVLCVLPFRMRVAEVGFLSWAGLRGAVPIILGCYPLLAGFPAGEQVFTLVFFIVVVNTVVPGGTLRWVANALGLGAPMEVEPSAVLEINSTKNLAGRLMTFRIVPAVAVCGARLRDIEFPPEAAVVLVVRGNRLLAAKGDTELTVGDHVYLFCRDEDVPLVTLLFGSPEDDPG